MKYLVSLVIAALLVAFPAFATSIPCDPKATAYRKVHRAIFEKYFAIQSCFPDEASLGNAEKQKQLLACNGFVGRVLNEAGAFGFQVSKDTYLLANEMARELESRSLDGDFLYLGQATEPGVNEVAQQRANAGQLVVAVRPDDPHGHIALVVPGSQATIGGAGWGLALRPPMGASWSVSDVNGTYVGCPLSQSWRTADGIRYYVFKGAR